MVGNSNLARIIFRLVIVLIVVTALDALEMSAKAIAYLLYKVFFLLILKYLIY